MADGKSQNLARRVAKVVLTVLACAVILGSAAGALVLIDATEPRAEKGGATRKSAALVDTIQVARGSYRPQIVVLGRIEPAKDIMLSPRVSGQVIGLDPAFVPGGLVEKGQLLLEIDPADFETTLAMRRGDLRQARAALALEKGRQHVAEQEYALLDEEIDPVNRALVLRQPQIEAIQAQVDAAEAAVRRAQLDVDRTRITAPFDAQILDRSTHVGSQVSPGDPLARLVGIDEYWVMAAVPLNHLRWVLTPERDGEGSSVRLRHSGAWDAGVYRQGRVTRMIGAVDEQTRLAKVLITVDDPLARRAATQTLRIAPTLILGSLLEARIEGRTIENVVRLDRDHLREGDTVWVIADDKLSIRQTRVVFRDARYAYISEGLDDGDAVVTTTLATVAEGIALRRADPRPEGEAEPSSEGEADP